MKKVLISGGAGFIGSNLCQYLIDKNHYEVYCVDNLISGNIENISHLLHLKNFHFLKIDVINLDNFNVKLDEIYHLASPASPKFYNEFPIETSLTNSIGTINLLKLALKFKAKFLFTSTSEIYGNPKQHPQNEKLIGNINPISIKSSYVESKRFGETITFLFHEKYNLNTKIVRLFNTYGPKLRFDDGRVVSSFVYNTLINKPLNIYGDGFQTRSFCYVDDIIDALYKTMQSDYNFPINLGNPNEEITIYNLAIKIKKLLNSNVKINFIYDKNDEIKRRKPDILKAKKILNWQPKISLEEGLEKTIRFFKTK